MESNRNPIIKIAAVGDICPGEHPLCFGYGIKSVMEKQGGDFPFQHVKNIFHNCHIVFGNLEGVIINKEEKNKIHESMLFCGEPIFAEVLSITGFNLLNLANNHAMNHNISVLEGTIKTLNHSNINIVGVRSKESLCKPYIVNIDGITIGFLGYSLIPDCSVKKNNQHNSNVSIQIISEIKALKKEVDKLVVSIHWGFELIERPSTQMMALARNMVDEGASVVLGHHPHVFQNIEIYKDSLIFYSLGNFYCDHIWWTESRKSAIVKLFIDKTNNITYELTPVFINNKYQPIPLSVEINNYFQRNIFKINESENDFYGTESYNLKYYTDVKRLDYKNQLYKVLFLIKNMYNIKMPTYKYMFGKILSRG